MPKDTNVLLAATTVRVKCGWDQAEVPNFADAVGEDLENGVELVLESLRQKYPNVTFERTDS